jgi:hypothetical protein
MKIAARTHSTVLSAESVDANAQITSVDETGKVTPYEVAAAEPAVEPAPAEPAPTQAAAVEPEPSAPVSTTAQSDDRAIGTSGQVASNELPRTASPLPLSGLLGLFSLAGGLALRAVRR